jgi:hypothetical protein
MALKNVELEIYTQIFDLLEADTDWAALVPQGNRIRYDDVTGDEDPERGQYTDADFDRAVLETAEFETNLYSDDETFGTLDHVTDWQEEHRYVYKLTLTSRLLSQQERSLLATTSMKAIRKGGPRLGLSYVFDVRIKGTNRTEQSADTGDQRRVISEILVVVKAKLEGVSLTEDGMALIYKYKITKNGKTTEHTASVGGAALDEAGFEAHILHHKTHGKNTDGSNVQVHEIEKLEETGAQKFDDVLEEVKKRQAARKASPVVKTTPTTTTTATGGVTTTTPQK